jgi:hypothetical protein
MPSAVFTSSRIFKFNFQRFSAIQIAVKPGYSGSCFVAFHADKAEAPAFSAKDIGNKLNGADFSV